MRVESLSVSSIKTFDFCALKFFIGSVLSIKEDQGKAAMLGSIFHKYFEIRAKSVLTGGLVDDKILGRVDPTSVDDLVEIIFNYYRGTDTKHELSAKDLKESIKLVNKTLVFNNGAYDPLKMNVMEVEKFFEMPISEVSFRGVIDLVARIDDRTILALDWKTAGSLKDFHSGEPITEESLYKDPQIRIYVYSIYKLFDVDTVIFTIYFVKHDKPFTIIIGKDENWKVEKYVDIKYKKISRDNNPRGRFDWKCTFCNHSRKKYGESGQTVCNFINEHIQIGGLESTVANYKVKK